MALSAVNIFKIGLIGDGFNPFLKRDHFIIAGHDANGAKLQAFGKVHGAHRQHAGRNLHMLIKSSVLESCPFRRRFCPVKLGCRADVTGM